ncbi:MAG: transaldolase family protein [Anaerolineae bacterium]|nr:transaldolase family protein [Anaerolineae bacterium]
MPVNSTYKSPLHQMASTTITDFWNDSCAVAELNYALEHGAVGATSNPVIVLNTLKKELPLWRERIQQLIVESPSASEVEIAWQIYEAVALHGSRMLLPVFEREQGRKGWLSIQTNPANYRSSSAMVEQALHFQSLAPNLQVKMPVTAAGIEAIEEGIAAGINITATVCFTVAQAVAVAEAVERGLSRRAARGLNSDGLYPACAMMIGRLDDWMQVLITRDNLTTNPAAPHWAGVAAMKRAYHLYQERGYRTRLLAAAYRHHLHWSEFIGGDLILTIPYEWQVRFNASDVMVSERINDPVAPAILDDLYAHIPDFRRAYDEDGLSIAEFDTYGATVRTLRSFISASHDLMAFIRETFMLPNPDVRS